LFEEHGALSDLQIKKKIELKVKFFGLMEEEELYWFRRCHETWLLKCGNNSEYFHRIANGRKRRQTIFSLQDGVVSIQGDKDLLEHATNYYKSLFGPGGGNAIEFDHNLWSKESMVSELENLELIKPFSDEEIKFALFQMDKNKAADPDGLPIEFFQVC
jgi:hypothetical protein